MNRITNDARRRIASARARARRRFRLAFIEPLEQRIVMDTGAVLGVSGRGGLAGWTVAINGGTPGGKGSVVAQNGGLVLIEGDSTSVVAQKALTVASHPSLLTFYAADPVFDASSGGSVKDAYELALLDGAGNSLVPTVGAGKDSFVRFTEGQTAAIAPGARRDGNWVTLNISGLVPGSTANMVVRLVNNDTDHNSTATFGADPDGVYRVPGQPGELTSVIVTFALATTGYNDNVGLTQAQNEQGQVAGLAPNNTGTYSQAILTGAVPPQSLFRSTDTTGITKVYSLPAGTFLMPFAVQGNTLAAAIAGNPTDQLSGSPLTWYSFQAANPDNFNHYRRTDPVLTTTRIALEDMTNGGDQDFNDCVIYVASQAVVHPIAARISGYTYIDLNNDGIKQSGETGSDGVPVTLSGTTSQGMAVMVTTATGPDGSYDFDGVAPGTYRITSSR